MPYKKILYTFLGLGIFFTIIPTHAGWIEVLAQWQDPYADVTERGYKREASSYNRMLVSDVGFTYDEETQTGGNDLVRVKTEGFKIQDNGKGLIYYPKKSARGPEIQGSL